MTSGGGNGWSWGVWALGVGHREPQKALEEIEERIKAEAKGSVNLEEFMRAPLEQAHLDSELQRYSIDPAAGSNKTIDEDVKDNQSYRNEKKKVIDDYAEGKMSTEEYVDPKNYMAIDRDIDDEWRYEAKENNKNESWTDVGPERDFYRHVAENGGWVDVDEKTFFDLQNKLRDDHGYVDPTLFRERYVNDETRAYESGESYTEGDTTARVYEDADGKYSYVTESDDYLIVKKIDEEKPIDKDDADRYKGLTKVGEGGNRGIDRLQREADDIKKQLDYKRNRIPELTKQITDTKYKIANPLERTNVGRLAKELERLESAKKDSENSVRRLETQYAKASEKLNDAFDFIKNFAYGYMEEQSPAQLGKITERYSEDSERDRAVEKAASNLLANRGTGKTEYIVYEKNVDRPSVSAIDYADTYMHQYRDLSTERLRDVLIEETIGRYPSENQEDM